MLELGFGWGRKRANVARAYFGRSQPRRNSPPASKTGSEPWVPYLRFEGGGEVQVGDKQIKDLVNSHRFFDRQNAAVFVELSPN